MPFTASRPGAERAPPSPDDGAVPLPEDPNGDWPPKPWRPVADQIARNAAWYSGDENALTAFYGGSVVRRPSEGGGIAAAARRWFWGRRGSDSDAPRQKLHAPAAADVAATAADLLFGEGITLQVPEAHEDNADTDAKAAEDWLQTLADDIDLESTLLEAAEVAAGLGGVFLRPVWDDTLTDKPLLTAVHADHAVPEFRFGILTAVTFWHELQTDGAGAVWRHLERYEQGQILHGLYIGTRDKLGTRVRLDRHEATAVLAAAKTEGEAVPVPEGIRGPAARYVPYVRPNRRFRNLPIGRAATEGAESFMDALDEAWTAWMREVRLVKPRIIVPRDFLTRAGKGVAAGFDFDQEVFAPLDMDPSSKENAGITPAEFALHTDDYAKTCAELFERIVTGGGFSPSTFGLIGDTATQQTATEIKTRSSRTDWTVARLRRYQQQSIADVAEMLMIIGREVFSAEVVPHRPRVVWPDMETDDRRTAETVQMLRAAQAISVATAVKMAQPDLEGEELAAEVDRILAEHALSVPDPGGFGQEQDEDDEEPAA